MLIDSLNQRPDFRRQLLKQRRRIKQRFHHGLASCLIDRVGLLTVHTRKIPCAKYDSCSLPRHPLKAYVLTDLVNG